MGRGGGLSWAVGLDADRFSRGLRDVERDIDRVSRVGSAGFRTLAVGATALGAAVGVGLAAAARTGWQEIAEQQKVVAKLDAALKSTGNTTGQTRAQLLAYADAVERTTGIEAENVIQSEQLLATFSRIGGEQFPRARQAAVDLSVAFEKDLAASSIMVGKALQDPVKGVSALQKVGVSFTAQQREQIRAMVEAGEVGKAQTIILRELEKQTGGAARALGDTLPGKLERLERRYEGITATTVERFVPSMERAADVALERFAPALEVLASDLTNIALADISLDRKLELAFRRLDQTGVPDAVRGALEKGVVAAATNGPRLFVDAFMAAPWQGQAVIAGLLLSKFGPGIKLAGQGLGKALGTAAAGAGVGGSSLPGVPRGVTPVYVTNMGAGGIPGGAPGSAPGRSLARTVGLAFGVAGVGIAAGMGLDSLQQGGALEGVPGLGRLFPSPAQTRKAAEEALNAYIRVWRQGGSRLERDVALGTSGLQRKLAENAREATAAFVRGLDQAGPRVRGSAKGIADVAVKSLEGMGPRSRALAQDTIIRMAAQMEASGAAPKGTVQRLVADLTDKFGQLPEASRQAAFDAIFELNKIGSAIGNIAGAADRAATAIRNIRPPRTGAPGTGGRATGGIVPGRYTGIDDRYMRVAGEERILTPFQSMEVGRRAGVPGLVERVLYETGGVIGGPAFARGGVATAKAFAEAQVGEPYRWGGGHEGIVDRYGWDCSGFASNAAARIAGYTGGIGTTMSLYPRSTPARGGEPVVFGFRNMGRGPRGEHMGIRIDGVWYDAGSGGVQRGDSRWDSVRVPPGLQGLEVSGDPSAAPQSTRTQAARPAGRGGGPGGDVTGRGGPGGGGGRSGGSTIPRLPSSLPLAAGDAIEDRHRDDRIQDLRAGDAGEQRAAAEGVTDPDKVAAYRERAVNDVRIEELRQDRAALVGELEKVRARIIQLKRGYESWKRAERNAETRAQINRAKERAREVWRAYMQALQEERALVGQIADVDVSLEVLGYEQAKLNDAITKPPTTPSSGSKSVDDSSPGAGLGVRAAIDYQARSDAFLRAALGSGDIGTGGRTAIEAAGGPAPNVQVTIMALHPGDPRVQEDIRRGVAAAVSGGPQITATLAPSGA